MVIYTICSRASRGPLVDEICAHHVFRAVGSFHFTNQHRTLKALGMGRSAVSRPKTVICNTMDFLIS
jgi:hypothetical protein